MTTALNTGYATYMNIQFCLFHRLDHLKLSPRYTTDLMGVAVQVEIFYPKISFDLSIFYR